MASTPRNQACARGLIAALSIALTTLCASAQTIGPSASSSASSLCLQNTVAFDGVATWLAAYANQTRTLLGPPLREPSEAQQKAYEAFNQHADQFKKLVPTIADAQFGPIVSELKNAYEKGSRIDQFVVEYAESLGAFRSETNTGEDDAVDTLPPNANNHARALRAETLKRADVLRTGLADLWLVLDSAKTNLADLKRGCRP